MSLTNILTAVGGFVKIYSTGEDPKVRLYHLKDMAKVSDACSAVDKEVKTKGREFPEFATLATLATFKQQIALSPYLLKEGKKLRLLTEAEADDIMAKHKASPIASASAADALDRAGIKTDDDLVAHFNKGSSTDREKLIPLINLMLFQFKAKTVLSPKDVRSVVALANCEDESIRNNCLNLLIDMFEESGFRDADIGYGLKYFLDLLPTKFLEKNQYLVLVIFNKLSAELANFHHTGKDVNDELEPILAALTSVSRAAVKSNLNQLDKATKDDFYNKLKAFCKREEYAKVIEKLSLQTNYLLIFHALWTTQNLVRISSSEHKAVTFLRKTGSGLLAFTTFVKAPLKAAVKLWQQGELPDASVVDDLKKGYKHAKEAFGFKDLPKPWKDVLEEAAINLIDPNADEKRLEDVYQIATQYPRVCSSFEKIVTQYKSTIFGTEDPCPLEDQEFGFGLVMHLSDLAMDHQKAQVRAKALDILEKIFDKKRQHENVRLLILTTLQNILDANIPDTRDKAAILQPKLLKRKTSFEGKKLFRKQKYPCVLLLPPSSDLLDEAKGKIGNKTGRMFLRLRSIFVANTQDEYRQRERDLYIRSYGVEKLEQLDSSDRKTHLETHFQRFMTAPMSDARVLLLQAYAGCGKTTFLQRVEDELFKKAFTGEQDAPIPLRIEMGGLQDPVYDAVGEGLTNKGFTPAEIQSLKKIPTVIMLDGVDEARYQGLQISQVTKLFQTNNLHLWPNAKVVFGRRIGGGAEAAVSMDQFYPYSDDSAHSAHPKQLRTLFIRPFDDSLSRGYIKQYTQKAAKAWGKAHSEWEKDSGSKYFDEIKKIHGWRELMSVPLTLRMVAEVLPVIVNKGHLNKVTKSSLYEAYVDRWIDREEDKLFMLPQKIETTSPVDGKSALNQWTWSYCIDVAAAMRTEGGTGATKIHYRPQLGFGAKQGKWDQYFGNDPIAQTCLRAAPIRKIPEGGGWTYSFYHLLLAEFFYGKATKNQDDKATKNQDDNA